MAQQDANKAATIDIGTTVSDSCSAVAGVEIVGGLGVLSLSGNNANIATFSNDRWKNSCRSCCLL
jgi:hypothetical protein